MATCTGERPLQCNHCDKDFQDNTQLIIHVNNHTGEKPCRCSHCGKAFARKNHFKIHVLVHTGENAYI